MPDRSTIARTPEQLIDPAERLAIHCIPIDAQQRAQELAGSGH